ncbi:hypothetical protein AAE478_009080 [Parahypoxylon ruwenzoriense]
MLDLSPNSAKIFGGTDELRERYQRDGYLFLKGLVLREDVLKAREGYFTFLAPSGVLAPGSLPVDGIFDAQKDKLGYPGMVTAHAETCYKDEFCKHPALRSFIAKFTRWGDNTLGLTRSLLRNNTPHNKAIGVHYDQIFLRYGDDTSITAWVPMGDVALDGGGLIHLEKGHTLSQEIERGFYDQAKETRLTDEETKKCEFGEVHERRWLVTKYEAGDVVLHTPYTIHASTVNEDPRNIIRLGTDLRFVNSSEPYDTRWTNVYTFRDGV